MKGKSPAGSVIQLLRHRLSELKVDLVFARLSTCTSDWRRSDFIPAYNKFYYICSGTGLIKVGGKSFRPEPGQLFFAPADVVQSYSVADGPPYEMYWCHFTSNIGLNRLFQTFGLPAVVTVKDSAPLLAHFQQLIDNRNSGLPTSSLKIQAALFAIIASFIDIALLDRLDGVPSMALIDTIHYIESNLAKEMTVGELSDIAHFHPNYFIRFFKNHLGVPPMRYIYERRLQRAKELLVGSDMPISEVAYMAGFYDAPHFSTAFKKHTGISPSEYRNKS